ncbi:MAG: fibronectin type III domain-containing protein [Planctomycetales bacterium]|nr:fibronectin type III domain-containing protein [Planctomycetales bacterium]
MRSILPFGRPTTSSSRKRTRSRQRLHLVVEQLEKRELLAGIVWGTAPSLLTPRSEGAAILAPTNEVMILGGGQNSVQKLASTSTAWTQGFAADKDPLAPAVVRSGSHILVYGGRYGNAATEEAFDYDYRLGDSQDISNLPTPRFDHAFAVDSSGLVYAIGGQESTSGSIFDVVERYSLASDSWSEMAAMPSPRAGAVAAYDGLGSILVFGGASDSSSTVISNTVYAYEISSNSWSTRSPMPLGTTESAIATDQEGRIYLAGGLGSSGPVASVQVYDSATDTWTMETDLPQPVYSSAAVVDIQDRLMVIGGRNAAGNDLSLVVRSQPLNIPDSAPVITSSANTTAAADKFYTYDVNASGNPPPTFALVSSPSGMTIDSASGLISWQPTDAQVGTQAVTVRAVNRAGSYDQSFSITVAADTTPPTPPSNLQSSGVTETTVDLSWQEATDLKGVEHYAVFKAYRCGWRGRNTCYSQFVTDITGTSITLTGLTGTNTFRVAAFDAAGNKSDYSNSVSVTMLVAPHIVKYDVTGFRTTNAATANFEMQARLWASGNPAPTMRMVSGPAGMTFDPATGIVSWTPGPADVGQTAAEFEATNSVTSAPFTLPITVTPDVPVLSYRFDPNGTGASVSLAGQLLEIQVQDASHTPSTFALVSGPSGLTLDPVTGFMQWTPTTADAGTTTIVVEASNSAGVVQQTLSFITYFAAEPTGLTVTDTTTLYPIASWNTPLGIGAGEIAGYKVQMYRRYRWGRAYRTESIILDSPGNGTSIELVGMKENVTYNLYVTAYNQDGLSGLRSTENVNFIYQPTLPKVTWTIQGFNGTTSVVAEQPMNVQFSDINPLSAWSTYQVVLAPPGFTIDSNSGLASWTPAATSIGATNNIVVRVTNQLGYRDISVPINVYFSGPVENLTTHPASGGYVHVTWDPPTTNAQPVVYYQVTQHYRISSRPRTRTWIIAGTATSVDVPLTPTGAVVHTGVTITPLNVDLLAGLSLFQGYV